MKKISLITIAMIIGYLNANVHKAHIDQYKKPLPCNHYITHMITDAAGTIAAILGAFTMGGITFGVATTADMKEESKAILTGAAAGLTFIYTLYKTPQWTDTYLLENNIKRTSLQNILVFLHRRILPWPIGVILGEFFAHDFMTKENNAVDSIDQKCLMRSNCPSCLLKEKISPSSNL